MKRFEIFSALILLRLDYSTILRYTEVTNTFLDCSLFQFFFLLFFYQRGTIVEKLTEETPRDWNHLKQLLSVCEGK